MMCSMMLHFDCCGSLTKCAVSALHKCVHTHRIAMQVGKSYAGPREALRLTGKFVLTHLLEAAKADVDLSSSPFVLGLHQEVITSMQSTGP